MGLLRSLDPADAYNGVNCNSLSYLTFYTRGDKGDVPSLPVDFKPPEYILPGCKDRPLIPLQPFRDDKKVRDRMQYTVNDAYIQSK